jgi:gliding motility-associated-like protein
VPNAFTPNNDSLNDKWNIVPVFVKDYHLKIYNGWGERVWETSYKHDLWNGIYKEYPAFNNVFIWQVDFTGWDNSQNFRQGNVTVLP